MKKAALGELGWAFGWILQLMPGRLLGIQQGLQQSAVHTTCPSASGNWGIALMWQKPVGCQHTHFVLFIVH